MYCACDRESPSSPLLLLSLAAVPRERGVLGTYNSSTCTKLWAQGALKRIGLERDPAIYVARFHASCPQTCISAK